MDFSNFRPFWPHAEQPTARARRTSACLPPPLPPLPPPLPTRLSRFCDFEGGSGHVHEGSEKNFGQGICLIERQTFQIRYRFHMGSRLSVSVDPPTFAPLRMHARPAYLKIVCKKNHIFSIDRSIDRQVVNRSIDRTTNNVSIDRSIDRSRRGRGRVRARSIERACVRRAGGRVDV